MKRLVVLFGLLLIFGCSSNGNQIEPQASFGYFGSAFNGLGTGDYIVGLSQSSNIATIAPPNNDPENVDYIIDLIVKAQNHGMKSILWVDHLFFYIDWETSEKELYLYPDYKERWDRYSAKIAPYMDSIYMFYVMDEPYWNGSQVGISMLAMKETLEIVSSMIRNTFPGIHVGSCFGYPSLIGDIEIPEHYTLVGFDNYLHNEDTESYFAYYTESLKEFKGNLMYPHQKLFLVPGGFQHTHNPVPQNDLIEVADFFYDLFLNESVELMIVFLYPSVPPGLVGLEDLPQLMEKYKEIGCNIIK